MRPRAISCLGVAVERVHPAVEADDRDRPGLVHRTADPVRPRGVDRHRLLEVGVQARPSRGRREVGVQVRRRRDDDGVEIAAREELVGVGVHRRVDLRRARSRAAGAGSATATTGRPVGGERGQVVGDRDRPGADHADAKRPARASGIVNDEPPDAVAGVAHLVDLQLVDGALVSLGGAEREPITSPMALNSAPTTRHARVPRGTCSATRVDRYAGQTRCSVTGTISGEPATYTKRRAPLHERARRTA